MFSSVFILGIAVLLRIFANPFANVFQKKLTGKGVSPLVVNFLSYFILSLLCLSGAYILDWSSIQTQFWINSAIMGVLGALGNLFLVKALQSGELSVLGPINAYKAVVSMLFGLFLLHEVPDLWGLTGVMLIIVGSYFVLNTTDDGFSWKLFGRKEIQYRIWAMILTAIEAIFVKKVILVSSPTHSFFSWCWFGALSSFIILATNKRIEVRSELRKLQTGHLVLVVGLVVGIGITQFATSFVFRHMPVAYALSLFQLSVLVNIFLGYRIFNEGSIIKKLVGAIIMIIGSILIILF